MPNQTEIDNLLIAGAFNDGVKIGGIISEELLKGFLSGHAKMPANQILNVDVDITDFINYEFTLKDRILAKIGSPYVGCRKYRFSGWGWRNFPNVWKKFITSKE